MLPKIACSALIAVFLGQSACSLLYDFKADGRGQSQLGGAAGALGQIGAIGGVHSSVARAGASNGGAPANAFEKRPGNAGNANTLFETSGHTTAGGGGQHGGSTSIDAVETAPGGGTVVTTPQTGTGGTVATSSSGVGGTTAPTTSGTEPSGSIGGSSSSTTTTSTTGKATSVCVGGEQSCAIVDGSVHCWTPAQIPSPTKMSLSQVTAIACGAEHTCAVAEQKAYCWGQNTFGQLGVAGASTNSPQLVQPLTGVTHITAGAGHTCAIAGGAVYCWGNNVNGQLGDNKISAGGSAPQAAVGLDAGVTAINSIEEHTCAVKNGSAYCWGMNGWARVGIDTDGNDVPAPSLMSAPVPAATVEFVAAGHEHTCAMAGGGLYCVGCGNWRELGYTESIASGADMLHPVAVDIPLPGAVSAVATGVATTCAIAGSKLVCWGRSENGQAGSVATGDPAFVAQATEIPLGAGAQVTAIALRDYGCAVANGNVYCWGLDAHYPSPIQLNFSQ